MRVVFFRHLDNVALNPMPVLTPKSRNFGCYPPNFLKGNVPIHHDIGRICQIDYGSSAISNLDDLNLFGKLIFILPFAIKTLQVDFQPIAVRIIRVTHEVQKICQIEIGDGQLLLHILVSIAHRTYRQGWDLGSLIFVSDLYTR